MAARKAEDDQRLGPLTIQVVVPCANRKTRAIPRALSVRSLGSTTLARRFSCWREALLDSHTLQLASNELYAGDHWHVVRSMRQHIPAGVSINVWIASAGYGLIHETTLVQPYSATFSVHAHDAVAPPGSLFTSRDWWNHLRDLDVPSLPPTRTIRGLLVNHPNSPVIISGSMQYLTALHDDIEDALFDRGLQSRLTVLSTGSHSIREPASTFIQATGRLRAVLGGAYHSLNARLLRLVLSRVHEWYPSQSRLAQMIAELEQGAPPLYHRHRIRLSDSMLQRTIAELLRSGLQSRTRCLNELRNKGYACEQERFAHLFARTETYLEGFPAADLP